MRAGLLLVLVAAVALGACGRRGGPQTPDDAVGIPQVARFPSDPASGEVPDRKFILDPILQ